MNYENAGRYHKEKTGNQRKNLKYRKTRLKWDMWSLVWLGIDYGDYDGRMDMGDMAMGDMGYPGGVRKFPRNFRKS